jgi:hypothetical protein
MMSNLGREPLTIVEIDYPRCIRTYGEGVCTASLGLTTPNKCFNTKKTCQVRAALSETPQTLRFAYNQSGLPKGLTVFPALTGVSTRPAEINISGIDPRTTALGKRARVTISLLDFTYHDTLTDPYRADRVSGVGQFGGLGYLPEDRGTFFGKLVARNPYYVGLPLRVKYGYVGDDIATMRTASYVISEWAGPDAQGKVSIVAKDILDLADNTKAIAPKASRGKLTAAIGLGLLNFTISPATVGDEYDAAGRINIEREVMAYTRSGDVFTITARGIDGSEASTHSINDTVQQCLRYEIQRPCDVIYNLLTVYANVNPAFIDLPTWQAENDRWLSSVKLTATITKPDGVSQLIGEITQHGFFIWWDELAQQLRFRANRPLEPNDVPFEVTDAANLITGKTDITMGEELRISALYFWHGVIDPTEGGTQSRNYKKLAIATVDENPYNQEAIKTIYSRWFGEVGDEAAAGSIAKRLLNRYTNTPKIISGVLDVKDREAIKLGGVINVTTYLLQDATGSALPEQLQVNYVEEKDNRLSFRAETYTFNSRYGLITETSRPDYAGSNAAQKRAGTYIVGAATLEFSNQDTPYILF